MLPMRWGIELQVNHDSPPEGDGSVASWIARLVSWKERETSTHEPAGELKSVSRHKRLVSLIRKELFPTKIE